MGYTRGGERKTTTSLKVYTMVHPWGTKEDDDLFEGLHYGWFRRPGKVGEGPLVVRSKLFRV